MLFGSRASSTGAGAGHDVRDAGVASPSDFTEPRRAEEFHGRHHRSRRFCWFVVRTVPLPNFRASSAMLGAARLMCPREWLDGRRGSRSGSERACSSASTARRCRSDGRVGSGGGGLAVVVHVFGEPSRSSPSLGPDDPSSTRWRELFRPPAEVGNQPVRFLRSPSWATRTMASHAEKIAFRQKIEPGCAISASTRPAGYVHGKPAAGIVVFAKMLMSLIIACASSRRLPGADLEFFGQLQVHRVKQKVLRDGMREGRHVERFVGDDASVG